MIWPFGSTARNPRKTGLAVVVLLPLCTFFLYARVIHHGWVWDDFSYAASFREYGAFDGVLRGLTDAIFESGAFYRPLVMLTFTVSQEPAVQHIINIFLHALNTVLVFQFARELMPAEAAGSRAGLGAAALGAMVFAVHPVGVEAVAWVSGRFDTLMCTFVLGTSLAALGGKLTHKRLALVFVLFACAMGSKESAIGLPVALPLLLLLKWRLAGMEAGRMKESAGALMRLLAVLALAAALYVAARLAVMRMLFAGDVPVTFRSSSFVDKMNVAALAVTEFAKLIVNPWSHSAPLHPFSYEAGSEPLLRTMVVLAVVLALLLLAWLRRADFPLAFLAALAMSWPTLHFIGIPNRENIISDRYALVPLALLVAGLAAAVAVWLLRRLPATESWERRVPLYAGAVCLLWSLALAAHSHVTIPLWHDEMTFWSFVHRQFPESETEHSYYIHALASRGRWQDAGEELRQLWRKHPRVLDAPSIRDITCWMQVQERNGNHVAALELFSLGATNINLGQQSSGDVSAFYAARGVIDGNRGDWKSAELHFGKAVEASSGNLDAAFRYAYALFMNGKLSRAEEIFDKTLSVAPDDVASWASYWRKRW